MEKNIESLFGINFSKTDYESASLFLKALAQDKDDYMFVFQTFDDLQNRKDGKLVQILFGTLDQHLATLIELNNNGAGIYVTVNKTKKRGRTTGDIVAIRAHFADADNGPIDSFPISPSIIVGTKNGAHYYWLTFPGEPLEDFSPLQRAIINHLGTDKCVHDLPRVLRMPGFNHLKDPKNPFKVEHF